MIEKMKDVTYQLTVRMPEDFNLDWVGKIITKFVETADKNFDVTGFYLVKEDYIGEVVK